MFVDVIYWICLLILFYRMNLMCFVWILYFINISSSKADAFSLFFKFSIHAIRKKHRQQQRNGELVAKFKDEYEAEVKKNEGKTKYDAKRKRSDKTFHWICCKSCTTLLFWYEERQKTVKLVSRSNDLEFLRDPSSYAPRKSRGFGAGPKLKAPEVRVALYQWFVDVRESLKGHLPWHMFKLKAQQLYAD